MSPGDIVMGSCSRSSCKPDRGYSQVIDVRKTSYGWSKLVLLCSCGYNYDGSTLNRRHCETRGQSQDGSYVEIR